MVPQMTSNLVWRSLTCWLIVLIVWSWGALLPFSQSITSPGDVVAGRPFTLECKITRTSRDRSDVIWEHTVGQTLSHIYVSRECNSSIPVLPGTLPGLSGGCQHVNGEEVYTVRIENVTEDKGRPIRWTCHYGPINLASVTLDIKVMVSRVSLRNPPGTLTAGDPTTFTCVTSASKPQACISCYIRSSGNVRELDPADCNPDTSSVQTTTRTLTFTASAEENGAELYCDADNSVTDPPVQSQVYTLNVHIHLMVSRVSLTNPPGTLTAGDPTTFTCVTSASKPQACISCYIRSSGNVRELDPADCNPDTSSVQTTTRTLTFTASAEENGAELYCDADNSVTDPPVRSQVYTLNVHFGPDTVQLRADSGQSGNTVTVTENSTVTFTCTSGESNPAAVLSWYNNNSPIPAAEVSEVSSQPGPNLGYLTTQRYTVRIDRYLHGFVIRCEALRTGHGTCTHVSSSINLDINGSRESMTLNNDPSTGLSKIGMLGVGIVVGVSVLALIGLLGICVLLRRGNLTWHREVKAQTDDVDPPPMGHYEDLDHSPTRGPQYEDVSMVESPANRSEEVVYENAAVS